MSFTDKENIIIKEKLGQVLPPSVDEAWSRMEEKLGPPPMQSGRLARFMAKYTVYLNTFIAAIILTSGMLLHSAVQRDFGQTSNISADLPPTAIFFQEAINPDDQVQVLDLPMAVREEIFAYSSISTNQSSKGEVLTTKPTDLVKKAELSIIKKSKEFPVNIDDEEIDLEDEDGEGEQRWRSNTWTRKPQWVLTAGVQVLPEVSPKNYLNALSVSLSYREFYSPQNGFQLGFGYTPVWFRSIGYVEKYNRGGTIVTDSSNVQQARYFTIQGLMHIERNDNLSLSYGLQYGRLIQLNGEVITKRANAQGTEVDPATFEKIRNVDAFRKNDFALVAEVDFHFAGLPSWGFGIKCQQSLRDLSTTKIGPNKHRPSALLIKSSFVLGKTR